jgi:hypothetical protein
MDDISHCDMLFEELMDLYLLSEPLEPIRFQRCRPASCLARSSEAPNMTDYGGVGTWLSGDVDGEKL